MAGPTTASMLQMEMPATYMTSRRHPRTGPTAARVRLVLQRMLEAS
jgi:hypothetical protein